MTQNVKTLKNTFWPGFLPTFSTF